jgi:hypothetical protein
MKPSKPDLVVLPFTAVIAGTSIHLNLEQALSMLRKAEGASVRIERSYPGATHAIGWTIFRRTPRKYLYEKEPLFRFERGARRHIRKAYAIHYSLTCDDGMTYSHLHP